MLWIQWIQIQITLFHVLYLLNNIFFFLQRKLLSHFVRVCLLCSPCVTVGGRVPGREDRTGDRGHGRQSYTKCKKGVGLRQKIHTLWLCIAHYQIKWEQNIQTHTLLIEKPLLLNQFQLICWKCRWVTLMWDWILFFFFVRTLNQFAPNSQEQKSTLLLTAVTNHN